MVAVESPSLLRKIRDALDKVRPSHGRLYISVADEPVWEPMGNDTVFVRWMCWSIDDGDTEIVPPQFCVLGPEDTADQLAKDLPRFFPDVRVEVDNNIDAVGDHEK